jgi:anaerobic selenocysteine-containing dehydrogenase
MRAETGVLRRRREAFAVDMQKKPTTDELLAGLMNGSRVPLDEIKRHPHGAIFDAEHAARTNAPFVPTPDQAFVAPADPGNTDRLDVANADMLADLASIRARTADPARLPSAPVAGAATRPFQLISRRLPNVYNSSGRDIGGLQKGKTWNPAFLHPDDLAMLGLCDGDLVEIASDHAAILGIAEAAPELRRGIVSMTHCYGDGPENDDKFRELGSSTGRLVDNLRDFDPHTGIPRMSAIEVSLRKLPTSELERVARPA